MDAARRVGDELLEEQRIAAGRLGDPLFARPAPGGRPRSPRAAPRSRRPRADASVEHASRADAAGPVGASLEQVGAGHPDEQHRRVAQARGDVEEQVQQRGLGQVGVVDDEDQRPTCASASISRRNAQPASSAAWPSSSPAAAATWRATDGASAERGRELVDRAIAHRLQDDLAQRPIRRALAVGRAAAGQQPAARRPRSWSARRRGATCRCPDRRRSSSTPASASRRRARTSRADGPPPRSRPTSGRSSRRRIAGASASMSTQQEAAVGQLGRVRAVAHEPPRRRVHPDLAGARPTGRGAPRRRRPRRSRRPGRPCAGATTSPVQTPQRARMPNGSCSVSATSSRGGAERALRIVLVRDGEPKTASTASLRSSAATPPWRAQIAGPCRGSAPAPCAATRRRGSRPRRGRRAARRRTSRAAARRPRRAATARAAAAGAGRSWRRIAASSARSSGDGSMPRPSTSAA